jgi:hypothetical protein
MLLDKGRQLPVISYQFKGLAGQSAAYDDETRSPLNWELITGN